LAFEGNFRLDARYAPQGEVVVDLTGATGYIADRLMCSALPAKLKGEQLLRVGFDIFLPDKTPAPGWAGAITVELVSSTSEFPWETLGSVTLEKGWNFCMYEVPPGRSLERLTFVFKTADLANGPVVLTNFKGVFNAND
jgi:hypothetical protein